MNSFSCFKRIHRIHCKPPSTFEGKRREEEEKSNERERPNKVRSESGNKREKKSSFANVSLPPTLPIERGIFLLRLANHVQAKSLHVPRPSDR